MRHFVTLWFGLFGGTLVFAAECPPSSQTHAGTHYKPIAVAKVDIGQGLVVSGRILSAGDCKPIANARVEHWQAGKDGQYQDRLYAYLHTDTQGRFRFNTEWPTMPTPHIHFKISAPGYQPLTTMWVGSDPVPEITVDRVLQKR